MSRFEQQFFEYFNVFKRDIMMQPLMLGGAWGSGGGSGGRPGGFIGYLPQNRVSYDLSEDANLDVVGSGSLLDNLNHIRYRIQQLETVSGGGASLSVYDNGSLIETQVTVIDFVGSNVVTNPVNGRVTVSGIKQDKIFTVEGELIVESDPFRIYNPTDTSRTITKIFLSVATPPSGLAVIVDVNKNGTTIFTNQSNRPQINPGNYTGYITYIDTPIWAVGEYLTMDIDQVGEASSPGEYLTVQVVYI